MRVLKSDFAKYNISDDEEMIDDLGMYLLITRTCCGLIKCCYFFDFCDSPSLGSVYFNSFEKMYAITCLATLYMQIKKGDFLTL